MKTTKKRKGLLIIGSCLVLLLALGCGLFYWGMEETKQDRSVVFLLPNENRALVFYKDDCSDCTRVFPTLYAHQLLYNDLVFINLNQEKNRPYISRYNLTRVPTVIYEEQRVVGTNQKQLNTFFQQMKGE